MITITKKNFRLYEISAPEKADFKPTSNLSDFHSFCIKKIGDAIRGPQSQHYWSGGCYMWFTDATQQNRECVWMTANGILMYEELEHHRLYRILFDR